MYVLVLVALFTQPPPPHLQALQLPQHYATEGECDKALDAIKAAAADTATSKLINGECKLTDQHDI